MSEKTGLNGRTASLIAQNVPSHMPQGAALKTESAFVLLIKDLLCVDLVFGAAQGLLRHLQGPTRLIVRGEASTVYN